MKKLIALALVSVMLFALVPFSAFAESTYALEFTLSDDGTYYIVSGYTGTPTEVVIPSEYE